MRKLFIGLVILLLYTNLIYAVTWDNCIEKYNKAKQFSEKTKLMYIYLKSTKKCLIKFKDSLLKTPNSEFTTEAMTNNINKIDNYINKLIPNYKFPNNTLNHIPKYLYKNNSMPIYNTEYNHFKKFKKCNGIHAGDRIYTAKHCNIKDAKHIKYDLSYIKSNTKSNLKISKLDLKKEATFKYYSMSKEGMFFNVLLKEDNCKFYKTKIDPKGLKIKLNLSDLVKKIEIRSNCLAIPSNSGGGVFQNNKLVGIISKTVFNNNQFLYSVIEPILPHND